MGTNGNLNFVTETSDTMEEKYLCITCKHCCIFFNLYCFAKFKECPSVCAECEHYVEVFKNE